MGLNHKFSLTGTFLNNSFNQNSKSKYLGKSDNQNELPSPATKVDNEDRLSDSKNRGGPKRMTSGFLKHLTTGAGSKSNSRNNSPF